MTTRLDRPKARVQALRERMRREELAAYLVPSTDDHHDEYVPPCWERRAWMSGFTGSAGELLVTLDGAHLWTDGRYFAQATRELRGSGIALMKMGQKGVPVLADFLADCVRSGGAIGVDPRVLMHARHESIQRALRGGKGELRLVDANLVDEIWEDRPPIPDEPVQLHGRRWAGETTRKKLTRLRKAMRERGVDALVISALDQLAWAFNVRGADVAYNPLAIGYGLITAEGAELFVAPGKVGPVVAKKLSGVTVRGYGEIAEACRALGAANARVWIDPACTNMWLVGHLDGADLVELPSPITAMKAVKNDVELAGMQASQVRDGVAMVRFLRWLEREVPRGGVTEISAADKLTSLRAKGEHFRGPSFRTISGYGPNGAIIHYTVTPATNLPLEPRGLYLVDSGGQYLDGTTDITRTVLLGKKATKAQKDQFTRVLQGHIALARAVFPESVRGVRLDLLARRPLWDAGLDYNHGTGHGVGSYLGVHEGPQSIGTRETDAALEPGNVLTNEPGYYVEGEYGIRIENLIAVRPDETRSHDGTRFLAFETLTLCPIDRRLIDVRLLSGEERKWLNRYHKRVKRELSPHLGRDDRAWLSKACATI